jgi:asparagine synthase (glutamine-hydrolysing)
MCGIAGAIDASRARAEARVALLNRAQWHRGPDHDVVTSVGGFTLGNTRLAIQDPGPEGNQPFVSADGRYHCVFNGEIYNHEELVRRYGLAVRTKCDGEVITALWSKLGIAALAELRGMFAIALVDSLDERIYLARDSLGIKPLYWRIVPEGLLFASEVRPLLQVAGSARVDSRAIARYLHLGAMAAGQTPFHEITALPPNSVASFDRDCRSTVQPVRPDGPFAGPAAPLGEALNESVRLHLAADVPTALLLSAGVDSAVIAAAGHHLGRELHCLTVATEDGADESGAAAETARHYGHRFERIPAVVTADDVPKFFSAMQRPSIDGLNTYVVCKAVYEAGFKVALSGLGGDEAVGGYSHFRLLRYMSVLRVLDALPGPVNRAAGTVLTRSGVAGEAKLRRLLAPGGPREGWELSHLQREVLPEPLVAQLTGASCHHASDLPQQGPMPQPGRFSAMAAAEVALYLQPTLLSDADCFSMLSSVELRVPFVDSQVFSASLALAASSRSAPGKEALGIALDDPYLTRLAASPKRGFSLPMRRWMSGPLAPVVKAADDPAAAVWSVLDWSAAERSGLVPLRPGNRWSEAWSIAALNAWLEAIEGAS